MPKVSSAASPTPGQSTVSGRVGYAACSERPGNADTSPVTLEHVSVTIVLPVCSGVDSVKSDVNLIHLNQTQHMLRPCLVLSVPSCFAAQLIPANCGKVQKRCQLRLIDNSNIFKLHVLIPSRRCFLRQLRQRPDGPEQLAAP